ncbi:hypothetical protein RHS04_04879 [Rhizoctonia solani]|uniref:Zn(2)-C6 fungal-type domain-containing protein n=1 Tax=Rhizoctonia solani TaxID=456999 RepID=A0A8H7HAR1_9AGAM|nr:hypothetical protein RHS04_04879 [Rhizoctonia solani]
MTRPPWTDESRLLCGPCSLQVVPESHNISTFGNYPSTHISSLSRTEHTAGDPRLSSVGTSLAASPAHVASSSLGVTHQILHSDDLFPPYFISRPPEHNNQAIQWSPVQCLGSLDAFPTMQQEPIESFPVFDDLVSYQMFPDDDPKFSSDFIQQPTLFAHGNFVDFSTQQQEHGIWDGCKVPDPDQDLSSERHNAFVGPGMSLGQNSLYHALMSLEHTSDESNPHSPTAAHSTTHSPDSTKSPSHADDTTELEDANEDPDGIGTSVCGSLTSGIGSDTGPLLFVLQSYANWINKMMFDPSRSSERLRNRILAVYFESSRSRHQMILTANVLQAVIAFSANYKPMLFALAKEVRETLVHSTGSLYSGTSSSPLHLTLEVNLFFLTGPVHEGLRFMNDIAPVLRRMCSNTMSQYIHLPSLLDHPDHNVRAYPMVDILYSMLTGLPTALKYDATTYPQGRAPGYTEPVGAWLTGQPSELTLILARISSLHDEFGIDIDPSIVEEIESDIRDFKPDPGTSAEPSRTIVRLVVLESWRQVGYINLYMRLCGETALGPRVQAAQRRLMKLITHTKPGQKGVFHLGPCLEIAGLVTSRPDERRQILQRLQSLPHSRMESFLKHGIHVLHDIWARTDAEGRPARQKKCDETRPACRRCKTAGIECSGYTDPAYLRYSAPEYSRPKHLRTVSRDGSSATPSASRYAAGPLTPDASDSSVYAGAHGVHPPLPPPPLPSSSSSSLSVSASVSANYKPASSKANRKNRAGPNVRVGTGPTAHTTSTYTAPSFPGLFSDQWSDAPFFGPAPSYARIEEVDCDEVGVVGSTSRVDVQGSVPDGIVVQAPTPPHEPLDLPAVPGTGTGADSGGGAAGRSLAPRSWQKRARTPMTSGQASLYDALFSLARPGEDYYNPPPPPPNPTWTPASRNSGESLLTPLTEGGLERRLYSVSDYSDDGDREDPEDPEGVKAIMLRSLPLDCNVKSNTLPFMLESYAIWIARMIFDPLRVAAVGRYYVFRQYELGETTQLRMLLVSHFARTVARSTDYDLNNLPSLVRFRDHMSESYHTANALSTRDRSRELDLNTAARAFSHSYELISIACKLLPLSSVLAIMQAGAPIFRRACPDPPEALVHLPSLLLNIDVSLRYYATMDVLFSVITNRPMFFRYDATFTENITESRMYIENHLGLQWLYGVPDRLVVTLARMNALREDLGSYVEDKYIRELEAEIASFRVVLGFSGDPSLTMARMVVQECWRQAAYMYLYMGLGGANSEDARVKKAHRRFMQTFKESTPGRHPDLFLIFPMMILGIATHQPEDQDLIRRRMLNLPDCARRKTFGNEVVRTLDLLWAQNRLTNRPIMWSDLRLACLRVTGM